MSNSDENSDSSPQITKRLPELPPPGYGLKFSEQQAQQITEFVKSPLFKMLKRVYGDQAKTRTARQCLSSAQNTEWLMYFKGIAAATDLFFTDLEKTADVFKKQTSDDDKEFKK